jgi:hypothetical protein
LGVAAKVRFVEHGKLGMEAGERGRVVDRRGIN